jgi:hypothetical protein
MTPDFHTSKSKQGDLGNWAVSFGLWGGKASPARVEFRGLAPRNHNNAAKAHTAFLEATK